MISPEILESATPANARTRWPGIMDLDEIQAGGCPSFWKKAFPGKKPAAVLRRCDKQGWGEFWKGACPSGCAMLELSGACPDGEDESPHCCEAESGFTSPGECAAAVFRLVVEGRLASEDPAFFKRDGKNMLLYWPLGPEAAP